MLDNSEIKSCVLESLNEPIVFVNTEHIILYMNLKAREEYSQWGDIIGKSIFHCHNQNSCQKIRECFLELQKGADELRFTSNEKHQVYIRAVRNSQGMLIGYYERYAPPVKPIIPG
jgi:sensor histidine kinase regulating citrate/malate metabolism